MLHYEISFEEVLCRQKNHHTHPITLNFLLTHCVFPSQLIKLVAGEKWKERGKRQGDH